MTAPLDFRPATVDVVARPGDDITWRLIITGPTAALLDLSGATVTATVGTVTPSVSITNPGIIDIALTDAQTTSLGATSVPWSCSVTIGSSTTTYACGTYTGTLAGNNLGRNVAHIVTSGASANVQVLTGNNVSAAAVQASLDSHVADTTAAHAASAISFAPSGTIASTTVQDAILEAVAEATTTLDGLTDVTITAAAAGDIVRHNGTGWVDAVGTDFFEPAGSVQAAGIYGLSTRPWYLDAAWEFFCGKPHDGIASINTTTLASSASLGATSITLTSAAGLAVGELIYVGTGASAESAVIEAISTNTLTIYPRLRYAHSGGETVGQVWNDVAHATTNGWAALGNWIAYAKRDVSVAGVTLYASGAMTTTYTDANSEANVPVGWESLLPADCSFIAAAWSSATRHPHARRGGAAYCATTSAVAAGMRTLPSIPVTPGQQLVVSANIKAVGGFPDLTVRDKTTGTVIAGPLSVGAGAAGWQNLGRRAALSFVVPSGTTDIEIRLTGSTTSITQWYTDDVRVLAARQPAVVDRYVIEDPGDRAIVVLGDSWTFQGFSALESALETRFGRQLNIINAGVSGQRLDQQNARFATDVAPYRPLYVIHLSGYMNDLTQTRTQAQIEADTDTLINNCRAIGAVPVLLGPCPWNTDLATSLDRADQVRARCDLHTI